MPLSDPDLWAIIAAWPLPFRDECDDMVQPPRICRSFEDNLRKVGDWTDTSARRITEIYRQFLYLKALSGEPVTPSETMDSAWHLHLEFPEDYAALCAKLGRDIPHRTDLSPADLKAAYFQGRQSFLREFDEEPANDLWPDAGTLRRRRFVDGVGHASLTLMGIGILCFAVTGDDRYSLWFGVTAAFLLVAAGFFPMRDMPDAITRCG